MDKIIYNATIVTQNKRRVIINNGYIVFGQKIKKIGKGQPPYNLIKSMESTNLNGAIVFPGFINSHIHLGESAYSNFINQNDQLFEYLVKTDKIFRCNKFIENSRDIINDYSLLLSTKAGTTTVCGGRIDKSCSKWKIRNVSGFMLMKSSKLDKYYNQPKMLKESLIAKDEMSTPVIFIHSLDTITPDKLKEISLLNKGTKKRFKIIIHIAEHSSSEKSILKEWGKKSIDILAEHGLLSEKTILIHGNWLDSKDLLIIKKNKANLVHCLSSNLIIDDAILNLPNLLKNKISFCLGTDGLATSGNLDILAEAKMVYLFNKLNQKITPQKIFDLITIEAAKVLGLDKKIGSIELNKMADFSIIRNLPGSCVPKNNLLFKTLINSHERQITDVIVNGQWIIKSQKLKNGLRGDKIIGNFSKLLKKIKM